MRVCVDLLRCAARIVIFVPHTLSHTNPSLSLSLFSSCRLLTRLMLETRPSCRPRLTRQLRGSRPTRPPRPASTMPRRPSSRPSRHPYFKSSMARPAAARAECRAECPEECLVASRAALLPAVRPKVARPTAASRSKRLTKETSFIDL